MPCDHLKALNLARNGDLEESHRLVQPHSDELSCLIHAYIHRVKGDSDNASYWYRRAGTKQPECSATEELNRLYQKVLAG